MILRNRYSDRVEVKLMCEGVGRTKQSEKDRSDINKIVARAQKSGFLTCGFSTDRKPMFGDFSSGADFMDMKNKLVNFRAAFDTMPPDLRNKFHNNPEELLDYVKDPANKQEAIDLGILPKPEVTTKEEGNFVIVMHDGVEVERTEKKPVPTGTVPVPEPPAQ